MPSQEVAFLRQRAMLWAFTGYDHYGKPAVSSNPCEIACRWNFKRSETLDPTGNTITLDATVVVKQRIAIDSRMWPGSADEWFGTGSGPAEAVTSDEEVYIVKTTSMTEDLKGRARFRTLGLMRYRVGVT
jgi:hypothetical protein